MSQGAQCTQLTCKSLGTLDSARSFPLSLLTLSAGCDSTGALAEENSSLASGCRWAIAILRLRNAIKKGSRSSAQDDNNPDYDARALLEVSSFARLDSRGRLSLHGLCPP